MAITDKTDQRLFEAAIRIYKQQEEIKRLREILGMTDPEGFMEYIKEKMDEHNGRN